MSTPMATVLFFTRTPTLVQRTPSGWTVGDEQGWSLDKRTKGIPLACSWNAMSESCGSPTNSPNLERNVVNERNVH